MSCCMISRFSTFRKIFDRQMIIASIHRVSQPCRYVYKKRFFWEMCGKVKKEVSNLSYGR